MAKVIKAGLARMAGPEKPKEKIEKPAEEKEVQPVELAPEDADAQVEAIINSKGEHTAAQDNEAYQAAYDELIQAAQDEVAAMLDDARKDALSIFREAESNAESIREEAWEEGYRQAIEQGKKEVDEVLAKAQREADEMRAKLSEERQRLLDELENQMLDISLEVAGKILHMELNRDDGAYISMLRSAVERMPAEGAVTVRLHTEEYERFFNAKQAKLQTSHGPVDINLVDDPSMNRFDAVIESPSGVVDAGADSQLRQMRKNMGANSG